MLFQNCLGENIMFDLRLFESKIVTDKVTMNNAKRSNMYVTNDPPHFRYHYRRNHYYKLFCSLIFMYHK